MTNQPFSNYVSLLVSDLVLVLPSDQVSKLFLRQISSLSVQAPLSSMYLILPLFYSTAHYYQCIKPAFVGIFSS